ncbi:MAG: hypothetical protein HRT89_20045 [Lentisphaeria bacterium]|nr:hypothetical protein [Lentisphaeria bacterium]NQZ70351.1 hypothetical protein [Lentisphaeria bacterium]
MINNHEVQLIDSDKSGNGIIGMIASGIFYTFVVGSFLFCLMNICILCSGQSSGCAQAVIWGLIMFVHPVILIILYVLYKRAYKKGSSLLKKHLLIAAISAYASSLFLLPFLLVFIESLIDKL